MSAKARVQRHYQYVVDGRTGVIADRAADNASKHGLTALTRTLAAEWGGRGVRVNAGCPGWVKTEMDAADPATGSYTDADITSCVAMRRFATADDISSAILFLADGKESGYINGACACSRGWLGSRTEPGTHCGNAIVKDGLRRTKRSDSFFRL